MIVQLKKRNHVILAHFVSYKGTGHAVEQEQMFYSTKSASQFAALVSGNVQSRYVSIVVGQ